MALRIALLEHSGKKPEGRKRIPMALRSAGFPFRINSELGYSKRKETFFFK